MGCNLLINLTTVRVVRLEDSSMAEIFNSSLHYKKFGLSRHRFKLLEERREIPHLPMHKTCVGLQLIFSDVVDVRIERYKGNPPNALMAASGTGNSRFIPIGVGSSPLKTLDLYFTDQKKEKNFSREEAAKENTAHKSAPRRLKNVPPPSSSFASSLSVPLTPSSCSQLLPFCSSCKYIYNIFVIKLSYIQWTL